MDTIPRRLKYVTVYRRIMGKIEKCFFIPKVNPSYYQVLGIVLSFVFWLATNDWQRLLLVSAILLADWYDGATARKYGLVSREGYLIDVVVDRISELVLFFPMQVMFWFAILNGGLSYVSLIKGKHLTMPLRFGYLIYLLVIVL